MILQGEIVIVGNMEKKGTMKIWHSVIIGVAIVIGFTVNGISKAYSEQERYQRGYELQMRMLEITPHAVGLGEEHLLYMPRISYNDLSINVKPEFYRYDGTELQKIRMTD